jgi:hypothetical protein
MVMRKSLQKTYEKWDLHSLLRSQMGLSLRPSQNGETVIAGELEFIARQPDYEEITDSYEVEIRVPRDFPRSVPAVRELQGRIRKTYHTQPDGTLCLGSNIRLQLEVRKAPTLPAFVEKCIIPFLYGYSHKEQYETLPQGELAHGTKGLIEDYQSLFRLKDKKECLEMIRLASLKKRVANKQPCFCGGKKRLGKCHNKKVNQLRRCLGRTWFAVEYASMKR